MSVTPTGRSAPMSVDELSGMLFAWDAEARMPVYFYIPESPLTYLPCFASEDDLRLFYAQASRTFSSIKQIVDGVEFFSSFDGHPEVKVVVNTHFAEDGLKIRFTQLEAPPPRGRLDS